MGWSPKLTFHCKSEKLLHIQGRPMTSWVRRLSWRQTSARTRFRSGLCPSLDGGRYRVGDKDRLPWVVPRRALSSVLSIRSLHTSPGGLESQAGSSAGTREQEDTNVSFPVTKALLTQGLVFFSLYFFPRKPAWLR